MIKIINIGGDPLGECEYDLKINDELITKFKHNRTDGLAKCLQRAAEAAELEGRLTEEQIKNWRKVLSISYGPYSLIMPEEEIRKIKNSMQMEINKCQPAQTAPPKST